jgi:hypothetical protein
MATKGPKRDSAPRTRSALQWAAILLGLYVAMHLAAGGMIRLVTGRDASEVIAPGGSATSVAATSAATATGEESSARDAYRRAARAPERMGECKLGLPIDSDCNIE